MPMIAAFIRCLSVQWPVMVPGFPYPIEIFVENVDPNGTNDTVKIFVLEKAKNVPVVTAVVNMPISEINVE
jgi:Bardet-Biedl syndrome 1 protein